MILLFSLPGNSVPVAGVGIVRAGMSHLKTIYEGTLLKKLPTCWIVSSSMNRLQNTRSQD